MKLQDVDLLKMLPSFMKEDKFDTLLATGMSNLFQDWSVDMQRVVIVGQIDHLNEEELDQLAKDQNIFWYNNKAEISVKRKVIKNASLIFNRLGTVYAVEKVINDYLDGAELIEWFNYNGDPHHFKVRTYDSKILETDMNTFFYILKKIKRTSQWLDEIILRINAGMNLFINFGILERSKNIYRF